MRFISTSQLRAIYSRTHSLAFSVVLGVIGGVVAVLLLGSVRQHVGPLETTFSVHPAATGRTDIDLAPLGSLRLPTHEGPLRLRVDVDRLQLNQAQQLLGDQKAVNDLPEQVERESKHALMVLIRKSILAGAAGGLLLALLRRTDWKAALVGSIAGFLSISAPMGIAAATINRDSLAEPRYTGLLTLAPQAIGDVRDVSERFSLYRTQLNALVDNVSRLYQTTQSLPTVATDSSTIRVLHISDLHLNPAGFDLTGQLVKQFHPAFVIDTGDINDWGTTFESSFVDRISTLGVPYVFIRGNHDSAETQAAVAAQKNAIVLDGSQATVDGLKIWGIGDNRFTPDKQLFDNKDEERSTAFASANTTRDKYVANGFGSDIALVHDPTTATQLGGLVPLVLAGHIHHNDVRQLGTTTELVQGSTGGAGLRGVRDDGDSVPLECAILYFDATTHRLVAYDQITVQGIGGSGIEIQRHTVHNGTVDSTTTTSTSTSTSTTIAR